VGCSRSRVALVLAAAKRRARQARVQADLARLVREREADALRFDSAAWEGTGEAAILLGWED